jgi:hypothetical protein
MKPTSRTLKLFRDRGYSAEVIERWIPGGFVRRDYLGIIDILAITSRYTIGVQSCGQSFSEHLKKMTEENSTASKLWLSSPSRRLILVGWRKKKIKRGGIAVRYEARENEIFAFDLEPVSPQNIEMEIIGKGYKLSEAVAIVEDRGHTEAADYMRVRLAAVDKLSSPYDY